VRASQMAGSRRVWSPPFQHPNSATAGGCVGMGHRRGPATRQRGTSQTRRQRLHAITRGSRLSRAVWGASPVPATRLAPPVAHRQLRPLDGRACRPQLVRPRRRADAPSQRGPTRGAPGRSPNALACGCAHCAHEVLGVPQGTATGSRADTRVICEGGQTSGIVQRERGGSASRQWQTRWLTHEIPNSTRGR